MKSILVFVALLVTGVSHAQVNSANGVFNSTSTTVPLVLQTNGTARLSIFSSGTNTGNVAIGVADPKGYKLAVGGRIVAEEMVVKLQANWPDYVFATDYKLPTLFELEMFILKHKHLPGVPSANIIKEEGVPVGEMNAILLQKIEELTLYVIELKKENEEIKKLINEK